MRITKDIEYALISLLAMAESDGVVSARELSERHGIPGHLLSKILQRLSRHGVVSSAQGATGGYALARPAEDISLADVAEAVHGPLSLVPCMKGDSSCGRTETCTIHRPMAHVHGLWLDLLSSLSLRAFGDLNAIGTERT